MKLNSIYFHFSFFHVSLNETVENRFAEYYTAKGLCVCESDVCNGIQCDTGCVEWNIKWSYLLTNVDVYEYWSRVWISITVWVDLIQNGIDLRFYLPIVKWWTYLATTIVNIVNKSKGCNQIKRNKQTNKKKPHSYCFQSKKRKREKGQLKANWSRPKFRLSNIKRLSWLFYCETENERRKEKKLLSRMTSKGWNLCAFKTGKPLKIRTANKRKLNDW